MTIQQLIGLAVRLVALYFVTMVLSSIVGAVGLLNRA